MKEHLKKGDALIVVDVQNDFCPGGALAVADGDAVVPVLNRWIEQATVEGIPVYASRDWHPTGHVSFEQQGGEWPPHCIQDTEGAAFHPRLKLNDKVTKITKGVRFDQDQYSVFDETGLADQLRRDGVKRVWLGGLAEDVCVRASAIGAREAGFESVLIGEATRPVTPDGGDQARRDMQDAGVQIISEQDTG